MHMERVVIVNDNDEVLGYKDRDLVGQDDIIRASGAWITNSKGDILLARRSFKKKLGPGKWSCATAGTVNEGEDYETNMLKELEEEIGLRITASDLRLGPKVRTPHLFMQWYYITVDLPIEAFTLQEEEVMDIIWVTQEAFARMRAENPGQFVDSIERWLPQVLEGQK